MEILKCELAKLVKNETYKTVNTLLRCDANIWMFNTGELNKEIPYDEKHSFKPKCIMKFETRLTSNNNTSKSK